MECEECGSSDIDVNETGRTDWKCQECGFEFDHPNGE
jgi:ribosomal protein L37AE/L43A